MLENPRQYIAAIASMATQPQQQYISQMENQVRALQQNSAIQAYNKARESIEHGYREILNRDNTFKGNENVRNAVDGMLQRAMMSVQYGIQNGNFNAGAALSDPTFFPAMLYTAKLKCGVGQTASDAMPPAGANMETVSPPAQRSTGPQLDPDLQGVADALGPAFEKELRAALADNEKSGDLEFG
jgi:hypothetical protein